ncbi:MAG: NAD(P)H-dependent oxidoreductase [Anaerolineaceae bacterium]|nr:NAD(P)H-dependent oxidoreductase [Anaerolineaceae bacterium]
MKIVVLNGSPKGELSVTMQYVNYLAKLYPQHEFNILHIAQRIKRIESDRATFDEILAQVRAADGVLWGFPLYILLVHAHYKRFIELVFERGGAEAFAGKYAAALSTSIHYFDHTAHNYMHAVCDDLGMRFVEGFSAEMEDLLKDEGRQQLAQFGQHFMQAIETKAVSQPEYAPLVWSDFVYQMGSAPAAISTAGKKVVVLHDENDPSSNLIKMVERLRAGMDGPVTVVNLNQIDIKASCQGCLHCSSAYHCAYEGKDDFIEFYKSTVMTADVLVFAGRMVDRYLSSRWKMVLDRAFFNTHTPVLTGKQMAFIISGPLRQNANLRQVLQGYSQLEGANLVGIVSDESGTSAEVDGLLDQLSANLLGYAEVRASRPMTFLGVAGVKIFRDDMYGRLRTVFMADHRAYKKLGWYKTFPQANFGVMLLNMFVAPIVNLPFIRSKFDKVMKVQMMQPLKQVVAKM